MGNLANKKTAAPHTKHASDLADPSSRTRQVSPRISEKDVFVPPTNKIYKNREWDVKLVRKLIFARALAPSFDGQVDLVTDDQEECPICLLCYTGGLNRATCCHKGMCTECFLQINPRITVSPTLKCPFCSRPNFAVKFCGPLTEEERAAIAQEQKKVDDLERKMREEEIERDRERERKRADERAKTAKLSGKEPEPTATDAPPPGAPPPVPSPPPAKWDPNDEESMIQEAIRLSLQLSKYNNNSRV